MKKLLKISKTSVVLIFGLSMSLNSVSAEEYITGLEGGNLQLATATSMDQVDPIGLMNQLHDLQQDLSEIRGQLELQQQMVQQLKLQLGQRETNESNRAGSGFFGKGTNNVNTNSAENIYRLPTTDKQAYEVAYKLVINHCYPDAVQALQTYLKNFPEGQYLVDANYWLGEVFLSMWQEDKSQSALLDNSLNSFRYVAKAEDSPKISQALLKLGLIEAEQGHLAVAKQYFTDVSAKYPHSTPARIAEAKLSRLDQDGKL